MALEQITDKIPEPLKRQVGPFPLWVWVGGIAGGLILYSMRGSGGGSSGDDEPAEAEEFDFEPIGGPLAGGSGGGTGSGFDDTSGGTDGGSVTDGPITARDILQSGKLRCPKGFRPYINANGKAACKRVEKPKARKGTTLKWDWKRNKWIRVQTKSFTVEEPHIEVMSAPNGSTRTISLQQVPGIGIASPDRTPRVQMEPVNARVKSGATDLPYVAMKVPPAPVSRTNGRPFHGANVG